MKTEQREILGFTVPITGVCETLAELVSASGGEDVVVKDNNNFVLAHSHFTIVRRKIVDTLKALTGIKPQTEKQGNKEVVTETEAEYLARLRTELGADVMDSYEGQIQTAVGAIPVDYTPGTRGSGDSAKPAKKWLDAVDQLTKDGKYDALLAKSGISTDQPADDLKVALANWIKNAVTAAQQAAAKTALSL